MRCAVLLAVAACGATPYNPHTEVELRSRADVRVDIDTPTGRKTLVPPGSAPSDLAIPLTEPPYSHEVRFDASISREPDGNVLVRCSTCGSFPYERPLETLPLVFPVERALDAVQLHDGELHIPFTYRWTTYAPSHTKSGTVMSARGGGDAFHLDLVTPASNVVAVRERTDDPRADGPSAIKSGIVATVVGVAMIAGSIALLGEQSPSTLADVAGYTLLSLGIPTLIAGPIVIAVGVSEMRAIVWDRVIYPPR
jgi:hypothetical protein